MHLATLQQKDLSVSEDVEVTDDVAVGLRPATIDMVVEEDEESGELMIDETLVDDAKKDNQPDTSTAGEHFHNVIDYEKHSQASNERVTVEIKQEPLDIFEVGRADPEGQQFDTVTEVEVIHMEVDTPAPSRDDVQHSPGASDAPNKCGICRQTFRSMDQLRSHLITHAELRPYVCEYCDAGFTNATALQKHLHTHRLFESFELSQFRPYICGLCGDTFSKSEELKTHHATHSRTTLLRPSLRDSLIIQSKGDQALTSLGQNELGPKFQQLPTQAGDAMEGQSHSKISLRDQIITNVGDIESVTSDVVLSGDVVSARGVRQRKPIQRQFPVDESIVSDQESLERDGEDVSDVVVQTSNIPKSSS